MVTTERDESHSSKEDMDDLFVWTRIYNPSPKTKQKKKFQNLTIKQFHIKQEKWTVKQFNEEYNKHELSFKNRSH